MRIKCDENISRRGAGLLHAAGHDVSTVHQQRLSGAPDETVFQVCLAERRALITLDRDFGEVRRFPPEASAGIVLLDLNGPATLGLVDSLLGTFLTLAGTRPVDGELWIVQPVASGCLCHATRKDIDRLTL